MYYLGIDVGTKFIGIAIGDLFTKIANPLTTIKIKEKNFFQAICLIKNKMNNMGYKIVGCVIGWPINQNGTFNKATKNVTEFCNQLKKQLPSWKIILQDERYTTKIANELMYEQGIKASIRNKKIDQISASIILQSFFDGIQK